MKIECKNCNRLLDLPDDRLERLGPKISFPCPECKSAININLEAVPDATEHATGSNTSQADNPDGRALKKRILKSLKDLPAMPQVAEKARRITADTDSSFGDLASVIETDQTIATRVMKLANSQYYGVKGTVTSIHHASVVLGMQTLSEVLTIACASGLLGTELKGYEQDSGDLWLHSLAVAGCSKKIAEKKNPALANDAFSAGLIHDCGKLVLHEYVLERRDDFRKYMEGSDKTFLSAEKEILGIDHAEIAGEICGKWNIPKKINNRHKISPQSFSASS